MANSLSRILYFTYPVLLFSFTVLAISSSNQAETVQFSIPPLGGEFNSWNPSNLSQESCEQKKKDSFSFGDKCTRDGSAGSANQYTNNSMVNQFKQTN